MTDSSSHNNSQLPACDDCRKRKIRCDRRVPQCSNCQRSRVPCVFTNEGKKHNTTRQLVDDVAGLNSRLSAIDDTNAKLLQRIDALSAEISRSRQQTPGADATPKAAFSSPEDSSSPHSPGKVSQSGHAARGSMTSFVVDEGGGEQFYGGSSTLALLRHARDEVENFVRNIQTTHSTSYSPISPTLSSMSATTSSSLLFELRSRVEAIDKKLAQTALSQDRYERLGDDAGLTLPPRELLDHSIEAFFEESNVERLAFHKQSVLDAIEQHYNSKSSKRDETWVLSFNNIVLLSLSGRSKTFREGQYVLSDIDYDLFDSRVEAIQRVLHRLDQFSRPRLVCVQALLTLSLVARRFLTFQVFERVFLLACQLAKHMGLNEGLYLEHMSQPMQEERTNVLWALYAIDKQRFAVKDVPCQLYLFELILDLPDGPQGSSTSHQDPLAAQLRLATFLEEVYKQLNSPQARRRDGSQRQSAIMSLNHQLDAWWENHQSLLTQCDADGCVTAAGLFLRYFFLSTKVLINHASNEDQDQRSCIKYSTEALRIIQLLCTGSRLLAGGLETLSRLFRGCSVIPYYVLFHHVLQNRQSREHSDQLSLLAACTNALGQVILPKYSESYFVRMHFGMSWCTDALRLIRHDEQATKAASSVFETSGPLNTFQQPGPPFQQMPLPQYHGQYPTEGYYASPALQSNLAPVPEPTSFVDFAGNPSTRPAGLASYADISHGLSNVGSSPAAASSAGKMGPIRGSTSQEPSKSSAGPGVQGTSAETFGSAAYGPMSQQQGQAVATSVYDMNPALFQNLFGSSQLYDDQQF